MADPASLILEIGPSYSPAAPRSAGWKTHIVDHADRDALRVKYGSVGVNLDVIEDVDTIWSGGPLHEAVPAQLLGSFDTLIASHVLEHMPDPIRFLRSAAELVRPAGVVSLALPDKRFCFDYFKPLTMTGDLLEAYRAQRTRHPLAVAWSHMAYSVTAGGRLGWGQEPIADLELMNEFASAALMAEQYQMDGPYHDFHGWYFTPASFSLIILELSALGLIDWHVSDLHGPEGLEFFVSLRRGRRSADAPHLLQERRMTLLRRLMAETRVQLEFLALATGDPRS